jgi:hypothetical protein
MTDAIKSFSNFRFLKWRNRHQERKRLTRRKQSAPVEKALSPRMSEQNSEAIYQDITQDITTTGRLSDASHIYQNLTELPPPVPALYSNMTFSTISQDSQWSPEPVADGGDVAPTNTIPPYISRYDSLVTWLQNLSTGVQE